MKIALVQQAAGPDRQSNRAKGMANVERAAAAGANLVVFAELAFDQFFPAQHATGDVSALAETIPGVTTEALSQMAKDLGVVIVANLFEKDGDKTFDTSPVIDADGRLLGRTRMVHITDYEGFHERDYYHPGDLGAPVFDTKVGKIGVAICYDRHFPEYMRALGLGGAELVVVPQAGALGEWPDGMFEAEMAVASFQNGYFSALCNRVGPEETLEFAGGSFVCNSTGQVIARAKQKEEDLLLVDLDLGTIGNSPARTLFLGDRRDELYPSWLCSS